MSTISTALRSEEDLEECVICGRHFTPSRIDVHENICKNSPSGVTKKPYNVEEAFKDMIMEEQKDITSATRILITNWRNRREELLKQINRRRNCTKGKGKDAMCEFEEGKCHEGGLTKVQNISGLCKANN